MTRNHLGKARPAAAQAADSDARPEGGGFDDDRSDRTDTDRTDHGRPDGTGRPHDPGTGDASAVGPGVPVGRPAEARPREARPHGTLRSDLGAALAAALLVLTAALVGTAIQRADGTLFVNWPPLLASWGPHVGPGTPFALVVAGAVVAYGPVLAARLPWRALLGGAWATAVGWTFSLALVDGWQRGIARRLTTRYEYLQVIDRFHDIPATLRDFTHHILLGTPDHWPAHIAGHPPAATLTFVYLDRIGLGGGAWAGVWCITVGGTACVAVLVTVRVLAGEALARRAAPFLALAPAAVWAGTSADGYFAAVAAWALALLALAVTGHAPRTCAAASGLLYGLVCYLSYGLTLIAVIAGAVILLGRDRARRPARDSVRHPVRHRGRALLLPGLLGLLGLAVVPVAFTLAGFDWWEAYRLLVVRYNQGAGGFRPYGYWVWANLACTVLMVGLATVAGLRRAGASLRTPRHPNEPNEPNEPQDSPATSDLRDRRRLALLVLAALFALLIADLSGMSKAETERIWLPFAVWMLPAGAFLTGPRAWLAAQAGLALLVNHLLLTGW